MKIQYLVASMTVAAVLVVPAAYSAPGGGAQVEHYLTRSAYASGSFYGANGDAYFFGQAYDDLNGVAQGYVSSGSYDLYGNYRFIWCIGPAYADAVSVAANGRSSSVNAVLDPGSQDCVSSYDVSEPITVTADGQFDGIYASSSNGHGKDTYGGASYKYNYKGDYWSQTFSDADNGFYSGTFTGDASKYQNYNRTKVK